MDETIFPTEIPDSVSVEPASVEGEGSDTETTAPVVEETEASNESTAPTEDEETEVESSEDPASTETVFDDYYWDNLSGDDISEATEEATESIEINEDTETTEATEDTVSILVQIEENTALTAEASGLIAGFSLFNVVVILCFFAYKFLRIFF